MTFDQLKLDAQKKENTWQACSESESVFVVNYGMSVPTLRAVVFRI